MQKIADGLNAVGIRTANGYQFTAKTLNQLVKKEQDRAIQAERVKATLFEDEASIGAF